MTKARFIAMTLLGLSALACDTGPGGGLLPSGPDKDPPEMKATKDYEGVFEGTKTKAHFFVRGHNDDGKEPLFLKVSFEKLPEGSEVTVGDSSKVADSYGSLFFEVDLRDKVKDVPLSDLVNKKVDLGTTIELKMTGYKAQTVKVPKAKLASGVAASLATVRDRPITFGDEPAASGPPKSLASVEAGTSMSKLVVLGPAKKLSDIDLVGVRTKHESSRTKKCDGYKKIGGTVTIKMVDYKVAIYRRRDGELVKEHVVQAEDRCPSFVSVDKDTKTANAYANNRDVETWLRAQLKELSAAPDTVDTVDKTK